ncbi:hypothetical protein [Adhaeribacter radiodurans]|uniref:Transposase n=1 Tax=Adhaeribacter radiodurans TaxID=2745197 RepID=A0A7L7L2W2_9BACT|nr:hypothetical protein [Adhaeribacter radiodurans]QMU27136.1 hypothetical protein HUW48_03415 [Adhaeribacter radiodurans]
MFEQLCGLLKEPGIPTAGLFLNADAGFDSPEFRNRCSQMQIEANISFNLRYREFTSEYVYFEELLFKKRKGIEQANAWVDSYKALLIRFEAKAPHWLALHFLALAVQLIRKINQKLVY